MDNFLRQFMGHFARQLGRTKRHRPSTTLSDLPQMDKDRAKRKESPYYRPVPFSDRRLRHLDEDRKG